MRVLALLALASALPSMSLAALALLSALSLLAHLRLAPAGAARLRAGLWRLRWLLLAIFVLYVGFTPGEPLWSALPGLSREGLAEGLRRALVLIDLLLAVYLLLALTAVAELVAAIRMLLAPLRPLGVDPQRIGLRLALALDGIGEMEGRLRGYARAPGGWARAARLIEEIERKAGEPGEAVVVPALAAPRWWEWLLPLVLLVVLHRWTP